MAEKEEQPKPDLGKVWRKQREEGAVGRLPSGRMVRGRTVLPSHILELGEEVPDTLTVLALKLFYGKALRDDVLGYHNVSEDREQALKVAKALKIVTRAFLLEPRVVNEPLADDEIYIDDVEPQDQAFIFDIAFLGADALSEFFRATLEQDDDLDAAPAREVVSEAT